MTEEGGAKKVILNIYGRVQGVGFRYAAQKKAAKFGVACAPRNEPDGSVSIEAEGAPEALERFIKWCHRGPWSAKVARVEVRRL